MLVRYDCAMTTVPRGDLPARPGQPVQGVALAAHGDAPGSAEREALVAALRRQGIGFLQPLDAAPGPAELDAPTLIACLAAHPDARLRHALAMLFLRRPELAVAVPGVARHLDPAAARELRVQYTAAVYLQSMWRTRLRLLLPEASELRDWFSAEMALPPPSERFGRVGLAALAEQSPYNLLASFEAMIEQLFDQLEREQRDELAPAG
jgi:hypothetical protein